MTDSIPATANTQLSSKKTKQKKMAFWGVELKPKKTFSLHVDVGNDDEGGRLLVTKATLGITGPEKGKVGVEYKVGSREPIPLCILIPNVRESCSLKVLFNEKEDVVFFVVGDRSVHLTGFHVNGSKLHFQEGNDHNDNFIDLVNTAFGSDDNDKGKENENYFIDLVDTESESDDNHKGKENDNNFIDLVDTESELESEQSEYASSGDDDCGAASPPSPESIKDMEERKKLLHAISKYPNFFGKKASTGNTQKAFKR